MQSDSKSSDAVGTVALTRVGGPSVVSASERPRGPVVLVGASTGVAGLVMGAAGAVVAGEAGWAAVAAILTLVANVAMAGAALAAFTLWRRQLRIANEHEIAIKALRSVLAVATAARRSLRNRDEQSWLVALEAANDTVSECIIDVRVIDESEAPVISAVWHLVREWLTVARSEDEPTIPKREWSWSDLKNGEPTAVRAFRAELDNKVAGVRDWAAEYAGKR